MGVKPQTQMSSVNNNTDVQEDNEISLVEILSLAETSIGSLKQILDTFDNKIYREFREIAQQISSTKSEISQLHANEMREGHIPNAGRELAAIVESTENATHQIMEAAETIMTADPSDVGNYYNTVNDNIMAIFEACSFQDITGQRISRVVETLEFIDKRVSRFAKKMGANTTDAPQVGDANYYIDEEEKQRAQRKRDLILNGPQDTRDAISQDDIDTLLDD